MLRFVLDTNTCAIAATVHEEILFGISLLSDHGRRLATDRENRDISKISNHGRTQRLTPQARTRYRREHQPRIPASDTHSHIWVFDTRNSRSLDDRPLSCDVFLRL